MCLKIKCRLFEAVYSKIKCKLFATMCLKIICKLFATMCLKITCKLFATMCLKIKCKLFAATCLKIKCKFFAAMFLKIKCRVFEARCKINNSDIIFLIFFMVNIQREFFPPKVHVKNAIVQIGQQIKLLTRFIRELQLIIITHWRQNLYWFKIIFHLGKLPLTLPLLALNRPDVSLGRVPGLPIY